MLMGLSGMELRDCQEIAFPVKAVERAGGRTGGRGKKGLFRVINGLAGFAL